MSERSDDPRDEVAVREMQDNDQEVRRQERWRSGQPPAEVRTMDDESRPTPGSAEGERDVREQSDSNVPRAGDDRH
jgi:hypothetical protein